MARGWASQGEKYVCADCIPEEDIAKAIRASATSEDCSYCGRTAEEPIAAHLDSVLEIVGLAVRLLWSDPNEELPIEGREGGYQLASVYTGSELILDGLLPIEVARHDVLEDLAAAFSDKSYCEADWRGDSEHIVLSGQWSRFIDVVRHQRRYFFQANDQYDGDTYLDPWLQNTSPARILDDIGTIVGKLGLLKEIPRGTRFFRARVHDAARDYAVAFALGTPLPEDARFTNRMSPAGIPMFYGAEDEATALAETVSKPLVKGEQVSIGVFELSQPVVVLDLGELPDVPSIFSSRRKLIQKIQFLADFEVDFTKPVTKDGAEHVEYVPTQIVTEYFRHSFRTSSSEPIHGIRYQSARNRRPCVVLFIPNTSCKDMTDGWDEDEVVSLGLVKVIVQQG